MPQIPFDDQTIYCTETTASDGTPLVLIHGAGGNRLSWPPQIRRARSYPVIAVELPGHGEAAGYGCRSLDEYARAVLALLDEQEIAHAVLAGHSMGGAIAQLLALQHPDRCAGLALVGTGAKLRVNPQILEGIQRDFTGSVELITKWSFSREAPEGLTHPARKLLLEVSPTVLYNDFVACNKFDVMDSIGHWAGPALVICGESDKMTPVKYSRYLMEQIPNARLEIVPGAGHMVMLEKPDAVAGVIDEFMADILRET